MPRHPIMNETALKSIRVPDLMGGINLRDSVSMIGDNQMTDALNMWWADGTLRTRPGIEENIVVGLSVPQMENGTLVNSEYKITRHDSTREFEDKKAVLCSIKAIHEFNVTENDGSTVKKYKTVINFYWDLGEEKNMLPPLNIDGRYNAESYFAVYHKNTVYCFLSCKEIYKFSEGSIPREWKIVEESDSVATDLEGKPTDGIESNRIYVPLVIADCKTNGSISMSTDAVLQSGVMYEGYNLLSSYYRMQYEGFNYEAATGEEGQKSHKMIYHLLENVSQAKYEGKWVTVKHIKNGVTYTHSVQIVGADGNTTQYVETNKGADGFKLEVCRNRVSLQKESGGAYTYASISEDTPYTTIEISAPFISDDREYELEKLFKMKRTCWYGGSAEGMNGGTRLFLCGNNEEKALVMWSGRDNPLYFPENSQYYVGDESGAVTGFGKQSNLLVIFKNHETWCTQYTRNTDITAENLIKQNVVDYTASSVYFPLTQINASVGCAYPDTVALCRNRLVWLSGEGKVCTLVTENQYNERNIYCVSEMVKPKLMGENGTPYAVDWADHYVLAFGNRIYLMDYNSYGYQYIASYSKAEDANAKIPWYYWETPENATQSILTASNGQMRVAYVNNNTALGCSFNENRNEDVLQSGETNKINCHFTTKLFDFDHPANKKNIQIVNLLLGNDGREDIKVEFVTDKGAEEQRIELEEGVTNLRSAGYITNKSVFPCIRAIRVFGVRVSTRGMLAVDGLQFNYKLLGGIR